MTLQAFTIGSLLLSAVVFPSGMIYGQYALELSLEATAETEDGRQFLNPWAGGLNNAQFSPVDLNGDTLPDLLVFEKAGNRWLPFAGESDATGFQFRYDPQWLDGLPQASVLGLALDYDGDSDADVFTYTGTGISVWRNRLVEDGVWKFVRYRNGKALPTERDGIGQELRMTGGDIPAIEDLDADGDLDILVANASGVFVEFHANRSIERFGHSDSLVYELVSDCWGRFMENASDDGISLDTCLSPVAPPASGFRISGNAIARSTGSASLRPAHAGSSLCLTDISGDGIKDMLIGDSGASRIGYLYNGGSDDDANMLVHEPGWPASDVPVLAPLFPAAFALDANGDRRTDIAISPQDRGFSGNFNSLLLYTDTSSSSVPAFSLEQTGFLQQDMLDFGEGSCPAVLDFDGDGDQDLVVGNAGYSDASGDRKAQLALLENNGALPPGFRLLDTDFANLSELAIERRCACPAFADLDGDADPDMITGNEEGQLDYFENIALPGEPASFIWMETFYQEIDAGSFAMPAFGDLSGDGLPDLVLGERNGNLNYYRNTGSASAPFFALQEDFWGEVQVSEGGLLNVGFSAPFLWQNDHGGHDLFVGSLGGKVFFFRDIYESGNPAFVVADSAFAGKPDGERSVPALADFDRDGRPDLVLGNFAGGMVYFRGLPGTTSWMDWQPESSSIAVVPNPAGQCFSIRLTGHDQVRCSVYDHFGRERWRGTAGVNPQPICLDLPPGIYTIKAQGLPAVRIVIAP